MLIFKVHPNVVKLINYANTEITEGQKKFVKKCRK